MRTLRPSTIAAAALAALLAAAPAMAQTTAPAQPVVQKQQGLGVFLQAGYVRTSTYNSSGQPDFSNFSSQGLIFGIGFGGNKSGAFGVGADINYAIKVASDVTITDLADVVFGSGSLKTQVLDIPVYGRFNIGGHNTKNAFTFYIPVGWFFDILMKGDIGSLDVKDKFNSFQTGPLVGAGFEVARIGVEARGQWTIRELQSGDTLVNGMSKSNAFTFVLLFKVRLH